MLPGPLRPQHLALRRANWLQVVRHLLGVCACWRCRMPVRSRERRALDIRGGRGRCERREVVSAHLSRRLEARRQIDQYRLTERRPEKADPERHAELRAVRWLRKGRTELGKACGHLDNWISGARRQARRTEDEVVT